MRNYALVAVLLPQPVRDEHARVRPARRAVHCIHVKIDAALGSDLAITAVFAAAVVHIVDILAAEGVVIEQIARRIDEDLRVARPAVPLARGAVGGNVGVVILCRPQRVLHELIDEGMRAVKPYRLFHIRIDGYGGEVFCFPRRVALYKDVLKAEDGKFGLVIVYTVFTSIYDLLQWRGALFGGALNVLLSKFTLRVEHLAEAQPDRLSRLCVYGKRDISRDVLPEVEHFIPLGRSDHLRVFEPFVLGEGNVVGSRRNYFAFYNSCSAAV